MYKEGKACWFINHVDAAMEKYKNCVHGTTKMTPFEMVTNTNKPIPNDDDNKKVPKFQVGDLERVPDKRNL